MSTNLQEIYRQFGISKEVYDFGEEILDGLKERFEEIDKTAELNQLKVLKAMQEKQVSEACLLGTTGYGYNDMGRDTSKPDSKLLPACFSSFDTN